MQASNVEIIYRLPSNVALIEGVLYEHSEDVCAPLCVARTTHGRRCKNSLDDYGNCYASHGPNAEIDGHTFWVYEIDPKHAHRYWLQLCPTHYPLRHRVMQEVKPGWTIYNSADDVARMQRLTNCL